MKIASFIIVAFGLLFTACAHAADASPPADPKVQSFLCGKTLAECEAKYEDAQSRITQLTAAYQGARSQRDTAQQSLADTQLQAFLAQQPPAKK